MGLQTIVWTRLRPLEAAGEGILSGFAWSHATLTVDGSALTGADIFRYSDIDETRISAGDVIRDFFAGADRIDLSPVDAAAGGVDHAFNFVGEAQ